MSSIKSIPYERQHITEEGIDAVVKSLQSEFLTQDSTIEAFENAAFLDINKVQELLAHSPKGTYQGIIPIDFTGFPVNMESFRQLADEFGCWLLEDSFHSSGGFFTDTNGIKQNLGNRQYADLAIFRFIQ